MECHNCHWYQNGKGCDGADCYFDRLHEMQKLKPGYNEKKYYSVDSINGMAYSDDVFSEADIYDYETRHPHDDITIFLEKSQIDFDPMYHWDTDDYWLEKGKQDAIDFIKQYGIVSAYDSWENCVKEVLILKYDIAFYDEIMRQATLAGLRKER